MFIILYIICVLAANHTAAMLVSVGPLTVAVGTLFFGPIVTLRDYIHNKYGKVVVYKVIGVVVILSILQSMYASVPVRIIVASAIALLLSEITDTSIYQHFMNKSWFGRVVRSNAVSVPMDSILFSSIAFLGVMPLGILVSKVVTDVLLKYGIGLLVALPKAYATMLLERAERG